MSISVRNIQQRLYLLFGQTNPMQQYENNKTYNRQTFKTRC